MKTLNDVKIGDVVMGVSDDFRREMIIIVVDRIFVYQDVLVSVTGRRLDDEGAVADPAKRTIRSLSGWTYPDIKFHAPPPRDKWSGPIKALAIDDEHDFECSTRDIDTVRNVAARVGRNWRKRFKVSQTITGCTVRRIA